MLYFHLRRLAQVGIRPGGFGLEYARDSVLHGSDGKRRIVKDALGQPIDYEEPPLLYRNVPLDRPHSASASSSGGGGVKQGRRFQLATRDVGPYFASGHVARGAAFGDLDDDGDLDIVVNHKDAAPAVLRNDTPTENRWIRLKLEGFGDDVVSLPLPDMGEHDGWVYSSQPVALHRENGATVIERNRQRVAPNGARTEATDLVRLDDLDAGQLEREAQAHGLRALPRRRIPATEEHVGSEVVLLTT